MLKSSQFTRSAVVVAAVISLGASPALARVADMPVRPAAAVANHTRQWTQPHVEGTGVRPVVSAAPAVPLTRAADASGGADSLLITIGASLMLALLIIAGVVLTVRHRAHAFPARQA